MYLDGTIVFVSKSQGTCAYTGFLVTRGSEASLGATRLSYITGIASTVRY